MPDDQGHLIPIALIPEGTDDIIGYIHLPAVPRVGEKLYVFLPELPNRREDQYQVKVTAVSYVAVESVDPAIKPTDLNKLNQVELVIAPLDQAASAIIADKLRNKRQAGLG